MADQLLYPSVAAFAATVEGLIVNESAKTKRAANLRWVARDVLNAAETDDFPPAARTSLTELLTLSTWAVYERIANAGATRERARDGVQLTKAAVNSMRTRASAWNTVARALGLDVRFPLPPKPPAKATVRAQQRQALLRQLSAPARTRMAEADRIRSLAILGVVTDTGARAGELVAMTLKSLALDLSTIDITRRPQGTGSLPFVETIRLSAFTQAALRAWLDIRDELIVSVQGAASALWVSLRNNHRAASGARTPRTPSGMPLKVRGLERAYRRAITRINEELAAEPGWVPVARTLEQLRRSIEGMKIEGIKLEPVALTA